ncbi:MAG: D-2-hydroxyacid dehydrogenase [Chloroflexia bacterium]|nr:D-2-hydroxyacid dehydrogenase [Chloroflexia bacterium]
MRVMLTPRQHIWPDVTDEQLERLKAAGAEEVIVARDRETQLSAIRDAEVLIGEINEEMLEHAGRLRWMQSLSSGVDMYLFPAFVESDIVLTSEKGLVGPHLADHAFGLLLALTRSIGWAVRQRSWENRLEMRLVNRELTGMTAGIIGLGGTGISVAERAQAFGMSCLAIDPDVTSGPQYVELMGGPERLVEMAGRSDVLFVCCPKTSETLNLVNSEVLSVMPAGGYLINVTRGGIVDEDALIAAIESGQLTGAGLDVTAEEPLPPTSPLWSYDQIIITPHIAGSSQHRIGRIIDRVCANLQHLGKNEPLEGVVDKRKGY